jgi:hypothetical protein
MMSFSIMLQFLNFYRFTRWLDSYVGFSISRRPAGAYGYSMHSIDGGRSGYLQPRWLAVF